MLSEIDINDVSIRSMLTGDLDAAFSLSSAAGWNQSHADWQRMLLLEPQGCFVAELHGLVVGTTLCCTFNRVAWLAMVIVAPSLRGRGIGRCLVQTGLDYAEQQRTTTVRLDATHLGEAVYRQLEFEPQFELIRMAGIAVSDETPEPDDDFAIAFADAAQTSILLSLDFSATQTDRSKLLQRLFQEWAPLQAISQKSTSLQGNVAGFLGSRKGRGSIQFGPCVGSEHAAIILLEQALHSASGQSVIVDIPADADAVLSVARRFGLTEQRRLLRMYRGIKLTEDRRLYHVSYGGEFG